MSEWMCSVPGCGRSFESKNALIGHEGSHKTKGEYRCPECFLDDGLTVIFEYPQGLGMHRAKKHGVPSKKGNGKKPPLQVVPAVSHEAQQQLVLPEPNVTHMQAPPLPDGPAEYVPKPTQNGAVGIDELIQSSLGPLVERYEAGMTWLQEVAAEEARLIEELGQLWAVVRALPGVTLEPPPGVEEKAMVFHSAAVGKNLIHRGEEWLEQRSRSFDAPTLARGLGVHQSSANRLIETFREQGKLRMTGKRGRARIYTSTIHEGDAE